MAFYPYNQRADITSSTAVDIPYIKGVADGYKLARGSTTLDGSSGTPVATGLAGVVAAGVNLQTSAFTTGMPVFFTTQFTTSTGNVDVYAWIASSSASNALAESTSTGVISWWAIGR